MSQTGLEVFDKTFHKTNEWLQDVMQELHTDDRKYAYRVLRASLHALRDRITVAEAADLGAQLPMLIRGFYFEGWKPGATPTGDDLEEFLERIQSGMEDQPGVPDPRRWAQASFAVMARRVDPGEIEDVIGILPEEIRTLWPEPAGTGGGAR